MNSEKNLLFSNEFSSFKGLGNFQTSSSFQQSSRRTSKSTSFRKYAKKSLFLLLAFVIVCILWKYNTFISNMLKQSAQIIRKSGPLGILICGMLVFVFCFPVILGFGALQYLIGFVYGPSLGVAILCPALFAGASLCFFGFSRNPLQKIGKKFLQKSDYFTMISALFAKRPLKMTLLCRASALPFVSVNVMLSVLQIHYWQYFLGLIVVAGKAFFHMYIGSIAGSDAEATFKITLIAFTVALNVAIGTVCGRMIQKEYQVRNQQMICVPFE